MRALIRSLLLLAVISALSVNAAHGFQFSASDSINGNFDGAFTLGAGMRMNNQSCALVGDPNSSCGPGANVAQASNSDDGNLNYKKYDLYTSYLKLTAEMLLKFPAEFKFMARGTGVWDYMASHTERTDLAPDAYTQITWGQSQLLDLWVSKDFNIGSQHARVRVGNQVISWGESIYSIGGINSTNALDFQKLATPGTQIKEAILPSPIVSFATGLTRGLNFEAYYQFRWNRNRLPPVGTYFSTVDIYNYGRNALFLNATNPNFGGVDAATMSRSRDYNTNVNVQNQAIQGNTIATFDSLALPYNDDHTPKNSGQYGAALHYKPESTRLDIGLYFMNYHDKMPVLETFPTGPLGTTTQFTFLENRKMYGASANFPLGNWAIGWELSYRPKDAVALTGCFKPGGPLDVVTNGVSGINCQQWIDEKKYQMILTGILSLTPGDHGWFLDMLRADTGTFTWEAVMVRYPDVTRGKLFQRNVGGVDVIQAPSAAYAFWSASDPSLPYPITGSAGTANSYGITLDFNWAYDGKIIPGWVLTPGVTYFRAIQGDTPTLTANYMQGAQSANFYLLFSKNPGTWTAGLNYTTYWGGDNLRQPLADRDFIGGYISRNF